MSTKGSLTGLLYNDFKNRQKSGSWNISEHYSNVNYIRSQEIPNRFLIVGSYKENKLYVYDMFFKTSYILSLFNQNGIIFDIQYNHNKDILAIATSEPPYLRLISTDSIGGFKNIDILHPAKGPINKLRFNSDGSLLFASYIYNNSYNVHVYDIDKIKKLKDLAGIQVNNLITGIDISEDDNKLFISYYNTIDYFHNEHFLQIYNYDEKNRIYQLDNNSIVNTVSLINTIRYFKDLEDREYLIIGSIKEPYLYFYNINTDNIENDKFNIIKRYIDNRISCICVSNNKRYLLIGLETSPYFLFFDMVSGEIRDRFIDESDDSGESYFDEGVTSICTSFDDKYVCITSRGKNKMIVLNLENNTLTSKVNLESPVTTPFSSRFFLGPLTNYFEIPLPEYSISINRDSAAAVSTDRKLLLDSHSNLAAQPTKIQQVNIYHSLDNNDEVITIINNYGTLVSNDININNYPVNHFQNIIKISSYNKRIALLNIYNKVIVLSSNNFTSDELYIINNIISNTPIINISVGNIIVLALDINNTLYSSNLALINPEHLPSSISSNISNISAGNSHISLLLTNKTLISTGDNTYNQCETALFTNIKQVVSGDEYTAALRYDGKVLLTDPHNTKTKSITFSRHDIDQLTNILIIDNIYHDTIPQPLLQIFESYNNILIIPESVTHDIVNHKIIIRFSEQIHSRNIFFKVVLYKTNTFIHEYLDTNQVTLTASSPSAIFQFFDNDQNQFFPININQNNNNYTIDIAESSNITIIEANSVNYFEKEYLDIDTKIIVNHDLGIVYPFVHVFDNFNNLIIPASISVIDKDNIEVDISPDIKSNYRIRVLATDEPHIDDYLTKLENIKFIAGGPTDIIAIDADENVHAIGLNRFEVDHWSKKVRLRE